MAKPQRIMDRKGFLRSLGIAAASVVARPAAAATARIERLQDKTKNPAANLPVKVQPEARNIARREPGA